VAVDIIKTLSAVDELLSNGENKVAIDMLLQHLNIDSNSSVILSTLGRAYRIDNQPEKAVVYLKKSLEVMRGDKTKNDNFVAYQTDKFCDDDMGFIESEANDFLEEEYTLEVDEFTQEPPCKENQENVNYRSSLHNYTVETRVLRSVDNIKRIKIVCRDRRACRLDNSGVPLLECGNWDRLLEDVLRSISSLARENVGHISTKSIDNGSVVQKRSRSTIPIDASLVTNSLLSVDEETIEQPLIDKNIFLDWVCDEKLKLFENDRLFWGEDFEDNVDDQDSEALDDLVSTSSIILEEELDEQLEEQIWDDFEGLDEFDEYASREIEERIQEDGKISREDRARQVAVEVLAKSDWDIKHLSLLKNIFIENGWSAAKAAIEREIGKSLLPEELFLARKIRRFWAGNEQYWMTFHKIRYNSPSQQTDIFYKSMSWPESLKIIRCFPSLPDIEEIYTFIDEVFDHWYNSNKLRRIFSAFFQFLKYRVESMSKPLQGETLFSFLYYETDSFDIDPNGLNNSISPERQELLRLGFQINQWGPPENRIKIIWETGE
jgi:tetratricopeptide (TPR) repeat protein